MPRDSEDPQYTRVTKCLWDANGIPIGTTNDNAMINSRINEVEYQDGFKAIITANTIAIDIFAQVDEEGKHHCLFDQILNH